MIREELGSTVRGGLPVFEQTHGETRFGSETGFPAIAEVAGLHRNSGSDVARSPCRFG